MKFAFTQQHESIVTEIHTPIHIRPHGLDAAEGAPLAFIPAVALWDSGASHSSLSDRMALSLGLKPFTKGLVYHSGGSHYQNMYYVDLLLPQAPSAIRLPVSEFIAPEEFDVIIGMDIITLGDFAITNFGGQTSCSFCMPPRARLDFALPFGLSSFTDAAETEGG